MATIVTRSGKGSPLTNNEVDANFNNLNSGKAELSGATFTGEIVANAGIALGDNDKATFGAGDDLQIYHDGSNSYISDQGTGNLVLQGSNLTIEAADGTNYIAADDGGSVFIYHPDATNQVKLSTTSSGISVTGEVSATSLDISGNIDVDGVTNLDVVDIDGAVDMASTLAVAGVVTANAGVVVDTMTLDGSTLTSTGDFIVDATADIILDADGADFKFRDGGAGFFTISNSSLDAVLKVEQSNEDFIIKGNDGGNEITALTLDMSAAGAATFNSTVTSTGLNVTSNAPVVTFIESDQSNKQYQIGSYGASFAINDSSASQFRYIVDTNGNHLFNTGGLNCDFRVSSDGNTNMLFVDGGTNRVGVGTASPENPLHINDTSATSQLLIQGDSNDASIKFNKSGQTFVIGIDATDNSFRIADNTTLGSNDRLTIASSGAATFNSSVNAGAGLRISTDGSNNGVIQTLGQDKDMFFSGDDGGAGINALVLDMSQAGRATFSEGIVLKSSTAGDFGVNINTAAGDSMKLQVVDTGTGGAGHGSIAVSDGNLTLDVAGDIILDADGGDLIFKDGGSEKYRINTASGNMSIENQTSNADIKFVGNDGGVFRTALTLDMSDFGSAIFNAAVDIGGALTIPNKIIHTGDTNTFLHFNAADQIQLVTGGVERVAFYNSETHFNDGGTDVDFIVESNGNANMLHVDGGNNGVGIGTTGTTVPLTVNGGTGSAASIQLGNHGDNAGIYAKYSLTIKVDSTEAISDRSIEFKIGTHQAFYSNVAGTVFNDAGANADFQVKSDNNSHMLFVDASTNNVHMGSSANVEGGRVQVTSAKTLTADIPYGMLGVNDTTSYAQGVGGAINFTGMYHSNGALTSFGSVEGYKTFSTSGNYDGTLVFKARVHGGNQIDKLRLNATEAVFNEGGLDTDFRVESDAQSHALFVDAASDQVKIGSSSVGTFGKLEIQNADERHGIGQRSWSLISGTSHSSKSVDGVMAFNTASAGNQLSIPITSQSNQHRPALVELTFLSGEYNTSGNVKAGFVRFAFQSLNSIGSVAEIDKSGNVASVASSGMNILINFTSAYTAGASNYEGVMCYYRIMHEQPQYVKMWDATLN